MNVYAYDKNAFDAGRRGIGELFAVPAAIAVQNAPGVLRQAQARGGDTASGAQRSGR